MVVSDALWYLFYGAGDGNDTGTTAPWLPQLAKSTDRGLTWTKLGAIPGITNGTYAARDMGGFVWKDGGTYYMHILNAQTATNGIPGTGYINAIYSATSIEGTWTYIQETPPLGASGSYDEVSVPVSMTENIAGTYHHYWSARTANTTLDPAWSVGHGTSATPGGTIAPDGAGAFISSAVTGTNLARSENPKKWYSATLGKYVIAANSVDSGASYTDGNDVFYSPSQTDFTTTVYRSRAQSVLWSGFDGINAVGMISPYFSEAGSVVDINGYVPFSWDADPPATFNGSANTPGYHRGRKIRQGVLEPAATAARMTSNATTQLLVKAVSHTDFIVEFAPELLSTATGQSFGFTYRMSANNGDNFNGYLILVDVANNFLVLYKNTAGAYAQIGSVARTTVKDADANNLTVERWKLVVSGSSHQLFLNGETTATLSFTDATYSSGSYVAFRGECDAKVRLFSMRTNSDSVTVSGLTSGDSVVLRGHGGVVASSVAADGTGIAVLTAKHFPLYAVSVNGVDNAPSGLVWGGDVYSFTSGANNLTGSSTESQSATGSPTIGINMVAASVQQQSGNGAVTVSAQLSGTATATQQANGNLLVSIPLNGATIAQAIATASLAVGNALSGNTQQAQSGTGSLNISITLSGTEIQQAYASGTLTNTAAGSIALVGASDQAQSASGILSIGDNLAGASLAISSATGNLTTLVPLAGATVQAQLASGGLTVTAAGVNLSGDAIQDQLATGTLTLRVNLNAQSVQKALNTGYLTSSGTLIPDPVHWRIAANGRDFKIAANGRTFRI